MEHAEVSSLAHDDRLRGWKEIGAYLHASERTAQRWELTRLLPVQRVHTAQRAVIFASRNALEAWIQSEAGRVAMSEPGRHMSVCGQSTCLGTHAVVGPPSCDGASRVDHVPLANDTADVDAETGEDVPSVPLCDHAHHDFSLRAAMGSRRTWVAVGAGLLLTAIVIFVAATDRGVDPRGRSEASSIPVGSAQHELARARGALAGLRSIGVRVTFANGSEGVLGVPFGGIATCFAPGGPTYAFSAERVDDGARIHVSLMEHWDKLDIPVIKELGVWSLRPGASARVSELRGLKAIQLQAPRSSDMGADGAEASRPR